MFVEVIDINIEQRNNEYTKLTLQDTQMENLRNKGQGVKALQ